MATAWFICKMRKIERPFHWKKVAVQVAMVDHDTAIVSTGGDWGEVEVLGGYALVKVRASNTVLNVISNTAGFFRLPVDRLDDSLGNVNVQTLRNLRDRFIAMGYTDEEIDNALPNNWRLITLRQLLRFVASRRRKWRHDAVSDEVIWDGEIAACKDIEIVDVEIGD